MARFRRLVRPGTLQHIIVRFLNREHLIRCEAERAEYLRRAGAAFERSDWRAISYAIMSSHAHLGALAGTIPFEDISRPLHSGFAGWLNRRRHRLGPLLAGRPATFEVAPWRAPELIAYHHNNPVRAGVVDHAVESTWSSHQAYVGAASPPPWLDVDLGLALCGLSADVGDRAAFESYVREREAEPRDPRLREDALAADRRLARRINGAATTLSYPSLELPSGAATYTAWCADGVEPAQRWTGDLGVVIAAASAALGRSIAELKAGSRKRGVSMARRVVVVCSRRYLGRGLTEIAALVGVSPEAARQLDLGADEATHELARDIAMRIRGSVFASKT